MVKKPSKAWLHNSFIGHATLMQKQATAINNASTTSPTAQRIAREIYRLARELELNLRNERIDK